MLVSLVYQIQGLNNTIGPIARGNLKLPGGQQETTGEVARRAT